MDYSVKLKKIIDDLNLERIYAPENADGILITNKELNRPGLQFSGFYDYFDPERIQIIGRNELSYILKFDRAKRQTRLKSFFSKIPKGIIISRNLDIPEEMRDFAEKYGVPLLRTNEDTSSFMSNLISLLNVELAPRITRHGVLVEVYGEGILLLGESGIGKSETAVELVKRGHRLIADDAVELRRVSNKTIVGSSPENIRHFIELRGIGIINCRRIFGMGAVKLTEKIDMIIEMEIWDKSKLYDRMGAENLYTQVLGVNIPSLTIPVKPGRNLAIIIEVAAMNNRQKKLGYNAASELLKNLGMDGEEGDGNNWDGF